MTRESIRSASRRRQDRQRHSRRPAAAAGLHRRSRDREPSAQHYHQPLWTLVGAEPRPRPRPPFGLEASVMPSTANLRFAPTRPANVAMQMPGAVLCSFRWWCSFKSGTDRPSR